MADNIQHGIDDNPTGDAEKGAKLGGVGGAVTGLVAGSAAGPVGAVVGAVVGGVAGAVASGVAVAAVDRVDNDNTISGIGGDDDHYRSHYGSTYASSGRDYDTYRPSYQYGSDLSRNPTYGTGDYSHHETSIRSDFESRYPGSTYDDHSHAIRTGYERGRMAGEVPAGTRAETALGGNGVPGIQTGGTNNDGSPDTRGITEKVADTLTGDRVDDKTGRTV